MVITNHLAFAFGIGLTLISIFFRIGLSLLFFRLANLEKGKFRAVCLAIIIITIVQGFIEKLFWGFTPWNPFSWIPIHLGITEGPFEIKHLYSTEFATGQELFSNGPYQSPLGTIIHIPNTFLVFNILLNLVPIIVFFFLIKFVLKLKGKILIISWIVLSFISSRVYHIEKSPVSSAPVQEKEYKEEAMDKIFQTFKTI